MTIYSLGLWLRRSSSCVILNLRNSSPLSLLPCVSVLVFRSIVVERVRSAQFPLGEKTLSASAGCHFQAVAGRGSTAEAVNARTRLTALEPRSLRAVERVGVLFCSDSTVLNIYIYITKTIQYPPQPLPARAAELAQGSRLGSQVKSK